MQGIAELQSALLEDLPKSDHIITSDMSLSAVHALWLKKSIFKKFEDETSVDADSKCLSLFKLYNKRCQDFSVKPQSTFEEKVIGEVKTLLDNLFFNGPDLTVDFPRICDGVDVGPGASIGSQSYNFYTKLFDGPLSCTSDLLYREYRYATNRFPSWLSAETVREKRYGIQVVGGNRLSFVPKTFEVSRSICTEPLLNMFFQKGLGAVLEDMLRRRFRINLSSQPVLNRSLARVGSLNGDFATIDLSSASDSISRSLVSLIFPPYFVRLIDRYRSPNVIFPDGTSDELFMVSSMGNAFTFPLQTMIFASIVTSCYRVLGIQPQYTPQGPENFAVFGDDIIVRKDAYHFVVRCLSLFGFVVNEEKSFNNGFFRESCGGDFYKGHDVRGVYIKSLKTRANVYSAINRLIRWSAKSGIFIPKIVSLLMSRVKFLPIPWSDGDSEGIKVPSPPLNLKRAKSTGGIIYCAYKELPNLIKVPVDESKEWFYRSYGKRTKKASYNPDGLLISFCGGYIRNSSLSLRSDTKTFKTVKRVTASWRYTERSDFPAKSSQILIDSWCGYQSTLSGSSTRLSWLKSVKLGKSALLAGRVDLRSDWEVIAELYL